MADQQKETEEILKILQPLIMNKMKKTIVLLFTVFVGLSCFAQTDTINKKENTDDSVFTTVQKPAEFRGGLYGWNRHLEQNLNMQLGNMYIVIPQGQTQAKATVVLSFIVDKKGNIVDIAAQSTIPENVHPELIKEAIRILKISPKWIPAKHNGVPVNYRHKQSITWLVSDQ